MWFARRLSLRMMLLTTLVGPVGCVDTLGDLCEAGNAYAQTCPVVESDHRDCGLSSDRRFACVIAQATWPAHSQQPKSCESIYDACDDDDLERLRRFWTCASNGAICHEADYVACEDRLVGLSVVCEKSLTATP